MTVQVSCVSHLVRAPGEVAELWPVKILTNWKGPGCKIALIGPVCWVGSQVKEAPAGAGLTGWTVILSSLELLMVGSAAQEKVRLGKGMEVGSGVAGAVLVGVTVLVGVVVTAGVVVLVCVAVAVSVAVVGAVGVVVAVAVLVVNGAAVGIGVAVGAVGTKVGVAVVAGAAPAPLWTIGKKRLETLNRISSVRVEPCSLDWAGAAKNPTPSMMRPING